MCDVYAGAYLECTTHLVDNTYATRICSKPQCVNHERDFTGEETDFCPKCGSRVVDSTETRVNDLPAIRDWDVSVAIKEAMSRVHVSLDTDCIQLWIPNKPRQHSSQISPVHFDGSPGNYFFVNEAEVDPALAKSLLLEDFAEEVAVMRKFYDSVEAKWGIFNHLTW